MLFYYVIINRNSELRAQNSIQHNYEIYTQIYNTCQGNLSIAVSAHHVIHVTYKLEATRTCTYDLQSEQHAIIITFNSTDERLSKLARDETASSQ